mgnify:CR=1 FL=1
MSTHKEDRIRMRILHKLPTPYNDMFFRALYASPEIDLQVYHLWHGSWRRPWKTALATGYPNQYMRLRAGVDWKLLWAAWKDRNSLFIIADWGHLASLAVVFTRLLRKLPVALWTDTPQEQVNRSVLKKWLRRIFLIWLLPRYGVIFGTGKSALRVLAKMGATQHQIVNLPCFVDLQQPQYAVQNYLTNICAKDLRGLAGCSSDGVVFSLIGTLMSIKAQEIGIRAFAECRRHANQSIGLLIVGDGPDRIELEKLVESLSLKSHVVFLGWQEPHQMDAVYMATDVVIHPARQDPFPLVVLEAMAWSKVIIGSDVCGSIEERVNHGVNGFSFPVGDVDALAGIMVDLVNNPGKLATLGRSARKTAEEWPVCRGVEIIVEQARLLLSQISP